MKIGDNLDVTVRRVHVRYEDTASAFGRVFAFGVTLDEFIVRTTDRAWNVTFVTRDVNGAERAPCAAAALPAVTAGGSATAGGGDTLDADATDADANFIHKLVSVGCLSAYWDCAVRRPLAPLASEPARCFAELEQLIARGGGGGDGETCTAGASGASGGGGTASGVAVDGATPARKTATVDVKGDASFDDHGDDDEYGEDYDPAAHDDSGDAARQWRPPALRRWYVKLRSAS